MLIENFNRTIDIWIKELEQYDFIQLCTKPSPASWSLGQLYLHLIADTNFYIEQIKICTTTNDHATEEASSFGRTMLLNNDFPDEVLQGAPGNAHIPQPANKTQLLNELVKLKTEMNSAAAMISESPFNGKAQHPGFNYFSANEWLQLAEMHFRHHLRQKKRIDEFLKMSS
jgi:hypothetical protein